MDDGTPRRVSLQVKMLIGFLIGLVGGLIVHWAAADAAWVDPFKTYGTNPIGQIFLRLLFMLVIPLLFSALVVGIAEMGDAKALKRIGIKTLIFTILLSACAVVIALAVTNAIRPGGGVDPVVANQLLEESRENAGAILTAQAERPQGVAAFLNIIPSNVVTAAAANDILAVMFFALFFGIGLLLVNTPAANKLQDTIQGIYDVTMKLIGIVIRMAPIAIACFMFNLASAFGWELLVKLGAYVLTVLLALGLHMFVIYPIALKVLGGVSPMRFFRDVQEAMVVAFSTASSNATLPTALRVAEEKLHLPRRVSRFVLTIGATANQNGTAIFEGVTVLFLAQFFNVHLDLGQQAAVLFVCILGGIGTAGVPAGSLPVVALILGMVGVPPEGIAIVLGVDRLLDMCRTTLNVTGDLTAAVVISRGEAHDPVAQETGSEADPLAPQDGRAT
ncbi:MAG TPA: dicarboxylate/amino acid:cation symporter [Allosphingosinicella sp.]|nr:dicarboxylate/amino acid:cation symporter [Allosphingosinicella sp.]